MGHAGVIVYTKGNDFITKLLPYNFANILLFANNIANQFGNTFFPCPSHPNQLKAPKYTLCT
jgi:hypothetical protein